MKCLKIQLILAILVSLSFSEPKPKPVQPPPPQWPTMPTVIPSPFPTPTNSGGGSTPPPNIAPKPYLAPPPPPSAPKPIPFKTFESNLVDPKTDTYPFAMMLHHKKVGYRSAGVATVDLNEPGGKITEQVLTLETLKREAENDALIAKHEYENNLIVMESNKLLFAQTEALYKKKVVGKQVYEQSRMSVEKMRWRSEAAKNRMEEYLNEAALDEIKIHKAKGNEVQTVVFARAYARLWKIRLEKAKAIEGEAQVERDYSALVLSLANELKDKKAVTETELIKAKKEAEQDEIILKAAHAIVLQNTKNLKDAEATVKALEATSPEEG